MDYSDRSSRQTDDYQESSSGLKSGSKHQPLYMSVSKQNTRRVQTEYMNIEDSDTEITSVQCLQTCRRPHNLQRNVEQSQVQKLLEGSKMILEDPNPSASEELRPAVKKKPDKSPLDRGAHFSFRRRTCSMNPTQFTNLTVKRLECVRIVLIGKTGVGKSATGNNILGCDVFQSKASMKSVTKTCQKESGDACGRPVIVVDTPGLFDTSLNNEKIQQEIMRCIELSAPGPHVFLLVIAVGPITQEERETLQLIKMTFGQKAEAYTMVLFTRGDSLSDQSIEDYIKEGDQHVQQLIDDCGGRFHVFNNKQKDPAQVVSLLKKIDKMMWSNKQTFYNDKMFLEAERAFRLMQINREREEEVRRQMEAIKAKYESEIKEIQDKLEVEKAKAKVREFLILGRGDPLLRQKRDDTGTTNTEKMQDQHESKPHVERKNDDQIEKHENQLSGTTDLGKERTETGRESDKDHKKKKRPIKSFKIGKKQRENIERRTEESKTASGEENAEKIKNIATDQHQQINEDLPKNTEKEKDTEKERLLQRCEEMEECKQKMEEAMKKYKETADMYAAELKRIEAKNAHNIESWEKNHGKPCVLQ